MLYPLVPIVIVITGLVLSFVKLTRDFTQFHIEATNLLKTWQKLKKQELLPDV